MLTHKEFEVLRALLCMKGKSAEEEREQAVIDSLHYQVFKSPAEVTPYLESLERKGYVSDGRVTEAALVEIEPCRVSNAVILAAGGSEISSKSLYSMPKGLYVKHGSTLIERQISQLQEAGIKDIYVVVGYKQEMYYFLEEKWGVKLIVNTDFQHKNNVYSLYMALDKLDNTYILNCDNYYKSNPFSLYEYNAYHAVLLEDDIHNEMVADTNHSGRITRVYSCAKSGYTLYGHAYIDRKFTRWLKIFLREEIDDFRISSLFWEEFVGRHLDELDMYVRRYADDFLYEFDSIQEIQNIDSMFLDSVSDKINRRICQLLDCAESDIKDVVVLQKGLTNVLFTFAVRGQKYIFRYPGDSANAFIYRKNEVRAQQLAAKSGADGTYFYIDETGIKVSKFRENAKPLEDVYYKDLGFMCALARKLKAFHDASEGMEDWREFEYNPIKEADQLIEKASYMKGNLTGLFSKEMEDIRRIYAYSERDGIGKRMCHNDLNADNCLLTDTTLDIIDWEFAGWNDPAYDFGRIIGNYDFDDPDVAAILAAYFGRPATELETLHWWAYVGIHNWYHVCWALYKESLSESTHDRMLECYHRMKKIPAYVLPKYEALYGPENSETR